MAAAAGALAGWQTVGQWLVDGGALWGNGVWSTGRRRLEQWRVSGGALPCRWREEGGPEEGGGRRGTGGVPRGRLRTVDGGWRLAAAGYLAMLTGGCLTG